MKNKEELSADISAAKQLEEELREKFCAQTEIRKFYEKELFMLERAPYKDGDTVICNLRIGGKYAKKECRLEIIYDGGWRFIAYPRRKDGEFSEKYYKIYTPYKEIVRMA